MRPDLQSLVDKIRAMRKMTRDTGFRTTRSQNELLAKLNADDLGTVLVALEERHE